MKKQLRRLECWEDRENCKIDGFLGCMIIHMKEVEIPEVGDPNYSSGHSIDVNGSCNMGCC